MGLLRGARMGRRVRLRRGFGRKELLGVGVKAVPCKIFSRSVK